jgi:hypothetical protein
MGDTDDDQSDGPPQDGPEVYDELTEEGEIVHVEPERSPLVLELEAAGLISEDLLVAELVATDGGSYDLSEMQLHEVFAVLDLVSSEGIRAAVDREGTLVVHYNDEGRMDQVLEQFYGAEPEPGDQVRSPETEELEAWADRMADEQPIGGTGRGFAVPVALGVVVVVAVILLLALA